MFCKWLPADQLERLQAEAEGLEALIPCAGALVVPRPLALGLAQGRALLVLDWLDLAGGDRDGWILVVVWLSCIGAARSSQRNLVVWLARRPLD